VRLLFDEQLSEELVNILDDLFPDSLHLRLLGAGGAADPSETRSLTAMRWELAAGRTTRVSHLPWIRMALRLRPSLFIEAGMTMSSACGP
jgi:hypothetical protein